MLYGPDNRPLPPVIQGELATGYGRQSIIDALGMEFQNPDEIAREKGLEYYDEIASDTHTKSVWNTRVWTLSGKERQIHAASESPQDQLAQQFLQWNLEELLKPKTLPRITEQVFRSGSKNGYAVQEILWTARYPRGDWAGATVIADIKDKDPDRFLFKHGEIYLKAHWGDQEGVKQPPYKFWALPFQSEYDNPYGTSLFQQLHWYVWFKKQGFKFWLLFLEKFGMPTVTYTTPQGFSDLKELARVDAVLDSIQQRTSIRVPEGFHVALLESTKTGSVGAGYDQLIAVCNREISKGILGQTLTTEEGLHSGSYAQSQTHDAVRQDILMADGEWFDSGLNSTPIKWLIDRNFRVQQYPWVQTLTQPGQDLNALAERDVKLVAAGVRIPQKYFYDTYNLPEPQPGEPVVGATPGTGPEKESFAADDPNKMNGDGRGRPAPTDALYGSALVKGKTVYAETYLVPLWGALKDTTSLPEFERLWGTRQQEHTAFGEYLHGVLLSGHLLGRWVQQQRIAAQGDEVVSFADDTTVRANIIPFDILPGTEIEGEILSEPLTPEEAVAFIAEKEIMGIDAFNALSDTLKRDAFAIAQIEDTRVVALVKEALENAVREGTPFDAFRAAVETACETYGVTELRDHHLRTVFRTNLQSAYHQGAHDLIYDPDLGDLIAYLQYDALDDGRTRLTHRVMDGITLPKDDPFWDLWWPPNGYNCRCDVIPITTYDAERRKIRASPRIPQKIVDNTGRKARTITVVPDTGFAGTPRAVFE